MNTLTHSEAVTFYAAQVRAALAGLDREVIDDLTDGLEADLTETVLDELWVEGESTPKSALTSLDENALLERFGPPKEYATELASAADVALPKPTTAKRRPIREGFGQSWSRFRSRIVGFVERHSWAREGVAMVRALRPVWWVARGWGLYVVVVSQVLREFVPAQWVPRTPLAWLICAITVGLSIQYGRKKFWQGRWGCRAGRLVSVVGLIAALIAVNSMVNYIHWRTSAANYAAGDADAAYWRGMEARSDGVFINGESATNLFVYDAEGQPVEGARVVDQEGRWVVLANPQGTRWNYVEPDYVSWYGESVPTFVTDDSEAPNVYPYTYEWYKPYSTGDYPEYDEEGNIILPNPSGVMEPAWPQATLAPLADSGREAEPGVEGEAGNADPEPQTGAAEAPSGGDASPAPEASSDPAPEPSPEPSEAE